MASLSHIVTMDSMQITLWGSLVGCGGLSARLAHAAL